MRRFLLFISLVLFVLFVNSCEENSIRETETKPIFTKFCFLKENNPGLKEDIILNIKNDTLISGFSQGVTELTLIASFYGNYETVSVNGVEQESGKNYNNFNDKITYELTGRGGQKSHYAVSFSGYNGVPIIKINTKESVPVVSKKEYVETSMTFLNCSTTEGKSFTASGTIRGRGNATWDYEKKPYKIKFEKKQTPFGFPENKNWLLLAEYSDKSLLRTVCQCELSKLMGFPYTINYQHVDLWLNDEYIGTYLLTDQVKKGENRVNISDDGFLIEHDYYYKQEPLWFESSMLSQAFTFKYPDADDGDIVRGDDNYNYIVDYILRMENALRSIEDNPDEYKTYIDVQSFAKWYLAQEILYNCDPNRFYILPSRSEKMMMYPMWDSEWSLGLAVKDPIWRLPPFEPTPKESMWPSMYYFKYLFKDPLFVKEVKNEWDSFRIHKEDLLHKIDSVSNTIVYTQAANFEKWPIIGKRTNDVQLIVLDSWEAEKNYVMGFLSERLEWINEYITGL